MFHQQFNEQNSKRNDAVTTARVHTTYIYRRLAEDAILIRQKRTYTSSTSCNKQPT